MLPAVPTSRGRTGVGVLLREPLKMPPTGCWKTCGITGGGTTTGIGVGTGVGVLGIGVGHRARLAGTVLGTPLTVVVPGVTRGTGAVKLELCVYVRPPIVITCAAQV